MTVGDVVIELEKARTFLLQNVEKVICLCRVYVNQEGDRSTFFFFFLLLSLQISSSGSIEREEA